MSPVSKNALRDGWKSTRHSTAKLLLRPPNYRQHRQGGITGTTRVNRKNTEASATTDEPGNVWVIPLCNRTPHSTLAPRHAHLRPPSPPYRRPARSSRQSNSPRGTRRFLSLQFAI